MTSPAILSEGIAGRVSVLTAPTPRALYKGYSSEEAVNLIKKRRRGAFVGDIGDHIPNIKQFGTGLADKIARIKKLAELKDPCR